MIPILVIRTDWYSKLEVSLSAGMGPSESSQASKRRRDARGLVWIIEEWSFLENLSRRDSAHAQCVPCPAQVRMNVLVRLVFRSQQECLSSGVGRPQAESLRSEKSVGDHGRYLLSKQLCSICLVCSFCLHAVVSRACLQHTDHDVPTYLRWLKGLRKESSP